MIHKQFRRIFSKRHCFFAISNALGSYEQLIFTCFRGVFRLWITANAYKLDQISFRHPCFASFKRVYCKHEHTFSIGATGLSLWIRVALLRFVRWSQHIFFLTPSRLWNIQFEAMKIIRDVLAEIQRSRICRTVSILQSSTSEFKRFRCKYQRWFKRKW